MDSIRVDRWLCAARIFKSRNLAKEACEGGLVKVNEQAVRPSHLLKSGDEIRATAPRGLTLVTVIALAEKRLSAKLARALYEDHSPPPPPPEQRFPSRAKGAGRPTKAERRAIIRFRGDL